ncbi:unnamed protein product [Ambrosiozyma monospora]|uniref:Unnamed protein product n=1 Tax=Ambrosiozyma monospora TaxID=43982 RepID=A0A9W6Z744_AMBMO|nr:unnamed protein product [Ambrosiozyma monospora]
MFDSLPIEQYDANMQAFNRKKPFPYGNMKGKVLNNAKFLDDGLDVELIMRRNVPSKFFKYFESPTGNNINESQSFTTPTTRKPTRTTDNTNKNDLTHFDEDTLEFGRTETDHNNNYSNFDYKLSPHKLRQFSGSTEKETQQIGSGSPRLDEKFRGGSGAIHTGSEILDCILIWVRMWAEPGQPVHYHDKDKMFIKIIRGTQELNFNLLPLMKVNMMPLTMIYLVNLLHLIVMFHCKWD